jgi:hypothetical protein
MVAALHVAWATGRVEGHAVLGRSPAQVEAIFGAPVSIERYPVRRDLRYRRFEVIFGDGRRASALLVTGVAAPAALRAVLRRTPGLHESRRYHCDARGCFGTFFTGDRRVRVIYGLNRGRPYAGVQVWPA